MRRWKMALLVGIGTGLGVALMIGAKWYHTTTAEPIDPRRGLFGMAGLEVWIDLNARMPDFARLWACETLLAREAAVVGGGRVMPLPHSCQPDFKARQAMRAALSDTLVQVNLDQALARAPAATAAQRAAFEGCFRAAFAKAMPASRLAEANAGDTDAMREGAIAARAAADGCLGPLGL